MLERTRKVLSSISEAVDLKKLFAPSTIAVVHRFDELLTLILVSSDVYFLTKTR
jgi:heptaprenylglyceryl phosphate synthase